MTPNSPPNLALRLFTTPDILSNAPLNSSITSLINEAFIDEADRHSNIFPVGQPRLPERSSLAEMLGPHGVIATIIEEPDSTKSPDTETSWNVAACAAAIPWHGDLNGNGTDERGWEIKTVVVSHHPHKGYRKQGLAGRCAAALEEYLWQQQELAERKAKLELWVQVVFPNNVAYWGKRGYVELRRKTMPIGSFNSAKEWDLVIMKREVEIEYQG